MQRVSEDTSDRPFAYVNMRALARGNLRIVHPQNRSTPWPELDVFARDVGSFVSGMISAVLVGLIAW
jgi:hypothetical protein